jgi:hypothetical protein
MRFTLFFLILLFTNCVLVNAQPIVVRYPYPDTINSYSNQLVTNSQQYLKSKLSKYYSLANHQKKMQIKLLAKLKKEEKRLLKKLSKKDSLQSYALNKASKFDSLQQKVESNTNVESNNMVRNEYSAVMDSLKRLSELVQIPNSTNNITHLKKLEQQLKCNVSIDNLIQNRVNELGTMSKHFSLLQGFIAIKKQSFY